VQGASHALLITDETKKPVRNNAVRKLDKKRLGGTSIMVTKSEPTERSKF
jgi:hypothetical protein